MSHVVAAPTVTDRPRRLVHARADRHDPVVRGLVEQAAADAHHRGHAEGLQEGLATAADHVDRLTGAVVAALDHNAREASRARDEHVQEVLDLALVVAEAVLGREPHDGGAAVAARVGEVLDQLMDPDPTVLVHPDDVPLVTTALAARGITVTADATLSPGDARVRGGWADVDLTRRAAWDAVREALHGG